MGLALLTVEIPPFAPLPHAALKGCQRHKARTPEDGVATPAGAVQAHAAAGDLISSRSGMSSGMRWMKMISRMPWPSCIMYVGD